MAGLRPCCSQRRHVSEQVEFGLHVSASESEREGLRMSLNYRSGERSEPALGAPVKWVELNGWESQRLTAGMWRATSKRLPRTCGLPNDNMTCYQNVRISG